jgi:hypothetical protein
MFYKLLSSFFTKTDEFDEIINNMEERILMFEHFVYKYPHINLEDYDIILFTNINMFEQLSRQNLIILKKFIFNKGKILLKIKDGFFNKNISFVLANDIINNFDLLKKNDQERQQKLYFQNINMNLIREAQIYYHSREIKYRKNKLCYMENSITILIINDICNFEEKLLNYLPNKILFLILKYHHKKTLKLKLPFNTRSIIQDTRQRKYFRKIDDEENNLKSLDSIKSNNQVIVLYQQEHIISNKKNVYEICKNRIKNIILDINYTDCAIEHNFKKKENHKFFLSNEFSLDAKYSYIKNITRHT